MNKIYRNIITLSLLIAGFVMFAHSVIPHNHHDNYISDFQHYQQENDRNSNEKPFHCDYLNIIDFENVKIFNFTKITNELSTLFVIIFVDSVETVFNFHLRNFIKTKITLPDYSILINISPTRGSPLS